MLACCNATLQRFLYRLCMVKWILNFFNIVSLQNSFICLSGLRVFWVWASCLGWIVLNCRAKPLLCTPSAPWTNAWKTVWFRADFKPVGPQRDMVYIWGLWCIRGDGTACTEMSEPKLEEMPPIGLCHEALCYQEPLVEQMDPEQLCCPGRKAEASSWRRQHQQPEVCPPQPGLQGNCKPYLTVRPLRSALGLRGPSWTAQAASVGAGLCLLLQVCVSWASETFLQLTPL